MEERGCFLPLHAHHPVSQPVFHFFIVAVGAEESSVKDGEIFNDLSELTRFEAKGKGLKGGRDGGKNPKNFLQLRHVYKIRLVYKITSKPE